MIFPLGVISAEIISTCGRYSSNVSRRFSQPSNKIITKTKKEYLVFLIYPKLESNSNVHSLIISQTVVSFAVVTSFYKGLEPIRYKKRGAGSGSKSKYGACFH